MRSLPAQDVTETPTALLLRFCGNSGDWDLDPARTLSLCLSQGAELNAVDSQTLKNPLLSAVSRGSAPWVQALLEHGARPQVAYSSAVPSPDTSDVGKRQPLSAALSGLGNAIYNATVSAHSPERLAFFLGNIIAQCDISLRLIVAGADFKHEDEADGEAAFSTYGSFTVAEWRATRSFWEEYPLEERALLEVWEAARAALAPDWRLMQARFGSLWKMAPYCAHRLALYRQKDLSAALDKPGPAAPRPRL